MDRSLDQYVFELPGKSLQLMAENDEDAIRQARNALTARRLSRYTDKLFRYPKEWVDSKGLMGSTKHVRGQTKGLIEVPFYPAMFRTP